MCSLCITVYEYQRQISAGWVTQEYSRRPGGFVFGRRERRVDCFIGSFVDNDYRECTLHNHERKQPAKGFTCDDNESGMTPNTINTQNKRRSARKMCFGMVLCNMRYRYGGALINGNGGGAGVSTTHWRRPAAISRFLRNFRHSRLVKTQPQRLLYTAFCRLRPSCNNFLSMTLILGTCMHTRHIILCVFFLIYEF